MKKIIVTAAVSAIAAVSFAGNASAAPSAELPTPGTPGCFGQVHRAVNGGALGSEINGVGELVQGSEGKGQGKNATAKTLC